MADINALYPQPVAPPSASQNVFMGNPLDAAQKLISIQGGQIANTTAQLEQNAKQTGLVSSIIGSLDKNSSPDAINSAFTTIARNTNIPSQVLQQWRSQVLNDPKGYAHGLQTLQSIALGGAGGAAPVPAPPGPGGEPRQQSTQSFTYGGPSATGLPPGEGPALTASADRAQRLQATATTTNQYHADLENLKQDSKVMENLAGPTVEVEKKLNQLSSRLGGFGVTMTPEQLKATESFDKIANQITLNQAQVAAGTDAGRYMVLGANPNTSMSAYGREGVIDMLQGNQDFIDTTRRAWLAERKKGTPANAYDNFVDDFSQRADPRVFQFNRMSRVNQQKFLSQMDPDDVRPFEQRYNYAIAQGWVKPLKAAKGNGR